MHIKADRDVLCFENTDKLSIKLSNNFKILHRSKETPPKVKNQNRGCPCLLFRGSLTVEAAFSATLFFLTLFSLLYLFSLLFGLCQVQMRLASAAQQYECFGVKSGTIEGILKQSVLIQWDEEEGICYVKQKKEIPFLGGQFFGVSLYQQMKVSGYKGKSMVSSQETKEKYVYVTESGSVYHFDRGCIYLNPGIQGMYHSRAQSQRNYSGGKYGSCKSCCKGREVTEKTVVYITPYGDSFHIDKKCSGLKRTIRKILLSKAGNMPPCSKCSAQE